MICFEETEKLEFKPSITWENVTTVVAENESEDNDNIYLYI